MVMYVVERHPNGSSRTIPATDVFSHLNQANIKVINIIFPPFRTNESPTVMSMCVVKITQGKSLAKQ